MCTQLHPALCNSMDCSPPGTSVHGIFLVTILEWIAIPSPEYLPDPGIKPGSPALQADFLMVWTTREAHIRKMANLISVSLKSQITSFGRTLQTSVLSYMSVSQGILFSCAIWSLVMQEKKQQNKHRSTMCWIFFLPLTLSLSLLQPLSE